MAGWLSDSWWARWTMVQCRAAVAALGSAVLVAGCLGSEPSNPTGPNPEPQEFKVSLTITNTGDGHGTVDVGLSGGSVGSDSCTSILGPDESCTVLAEHTERIESMTVTAEPEPYSRFASYSRGCMDSDPVCTVVTPMEQSSSISVDLAYQLVVAVVEFSPDPVQVAPGGDLALSASAYSDEARSRPVEAAQFTWESSNESVVTIAPQDAATAIVTGHQAGEAWIRATAREKTDSVQVVVGG